MADVDGDGVVLSFVGRDCCSCCDDEASYEEKSKMHRDFPSRACESFISSKKCVARR